MCVCVCVCVCVCEPGRRDQTNSSNSKYGQQFLIFCVLYCKLADCVFNEQPWQQNYLFVLEMYVCWLFSTNKLDNDVPFFVFEVKSVDCVFNQ